MFPFPFHSQPVKAEPASFMRGDGAGQTSDAGVAHSMVETRSYVLLESLYTFLSHEIRSNEQMNSLMPMTSRIDYELSYENFQKRSVEHPFGEWKKGSGVLAGVSISV